MTPFPRNWQQVISTDKLTKWKNTKESAIEKTNHSENHPYPLFAKEGEFLRFVELARR